MKFILSAFSLLNFVVDNHWLLKNTCYLVDSDYQSIAKLHNRTFISFKKPKGAELLAIYKQANQYLAKCPILIDHKIDLIKLFKIVTQGYRNRRQRYDLRMEVFAGLVNFELSLLLL